MLIVKYYSHNNSCVTAHWGSGLINRLLASGSFSRRQKWTINPASFRDDVVCFSSFLVVVGSRPKISQVRSYPNSSMCWAEINPVLWLRIRNSAESRSTSWRQYALNRVIKGPWRYYPNMEYFSLYDSLILILQWSCVPTIIWGQTSVNIPDQNSPNPLWYSLVLIKYPNFFLDYNNFAYINKNIHW